MKTQTTVEQRLQKARTFGAYKGKLSSRPGVFSLPERSLSSVPHFSSLTAALC
jgi:hypothetical protein